VIWDKTDLFKKRGQRILKDLVRAQEHYVKKGSFKDSNEFMEMDLYPVYYSFVTAKEPPSPGVMDTYREKIDEQVINSLISIQYLEITKGRFVFVEPIDRSRTIPMECQVQEIDRVGGVQCQWVKDEEIVVYGDLYINTLERTLVFTLDGNNFTYSWVSHDP
jgi:hypothetical protein